ncbi:MAG: CHASE2 domain-containing protein, partial [Cyanobacteriota bacterium]
MLKTFLTYKPIIITVSLVAVFLIVILQLLWAENLELMAYDIRSRFRMKPAATDIVIVNIDNTTLEKVKNKKELGFGRFPWPRTVISKAMQFISSGNPKLILVDLNVEGDTLYTDKAFSDQTFIEHLKNIPDTFFVQSIRISEEELKLNALQQLEQFQAQQSFNKNDITQEKINQSLEMLIKHIKQDEPPSKKLSKHFFNIKNNLRKINNNKLSYYQINKMPDGLYKYSTKIGANLSFSDSDRVVRSYQPVFLYYGKFFFSVPL